MSETGVSNVEQFKRIRQAQILNRINSLNYQGVPLVVCLRHKRHDQSVYLKAKPEPIADKQSTATWVKESHFPASFVNYSLEKVILSSKYGAYEFIPESYQLGEDEFSYVVPEEAFDSGTRKQLRYLCSAQQNTATLIQNAAVYPARLENFSAAGTLVHLNENQGASLEWINLDIPGMLNIVSEQGAVYTGQVDIFHRGGSDYLLKPSTAATPRYTSKKYRARRQRLNPSPDLSFTHPVTGRHFSLKLIDLGSLGFSVFEEKTRASLIPGLLIRDMEVTFAGNPLIRCLAQVVYCEQDTEDPQRIRVGFAILDIDVEDHLRLISLIQQAEDPQAYVGNQVPAADLFEFFFETGFLYPNKYKEIVGRRQEMIDTYTKLYEKGSAICRHFVYQRSGEILGHFSSLRIFRKTWLTQHHAAMNSKRAGLKVLRAVSEFANDSYQLNTANFRYIIGYYQPSKKFPRNYFGRFVDKVQDPKVTSEDLFAYVNEGRRFLNAPRDLPPNWSLQPTVESDVMEFYSFYQKFSGGLLPEAQDLVPDGFDNHDLTRLYENNGLVRQRLLLTLTYEHSAKALIDVQTTDFGLNLSEITNAITVYMIEPNPDYGPAVCSAICQLALEYNKMSMPVMMFPGHYLSDCKVSADKEYMAWTMDSPKAMPQYMAWMNRFCR